MKGMCYLGWPSAFLPLPAHGSAVFVLENVTSIGANERNLPFHSARHACEQ